MVEFTLEFQRLEPEEFARDYLRGDRRRVRRRRRGLPVRPPPARRPRRCSRALGFDVRTGPARRGRLLVGDPPPAPRGRGGEGAAALLGRPPEVEGIVVEGDARGGTLGFPTANVAAEPDLLVPRHGIYAGFAGGHRAAISIGTNPHYGGDELRIEAFLLGFAGDLYGKRLVVELWRRLRDERAFESEQDADRPDRPRRRGDRAGRAAVLEPRTAAPLRRGSAAAPGARDEADAAEVVVAVRPAAHRQPAPLELRERVLVDARLGVDDVAGAVDARPVDRRLRLEPLVEDRRRDADERGAQPRPARRADREHEARRSSSARLGAIMLCIRVPGSSAPTSRSTSPSMLFRCRSSPGSQSPEPRPRLVVRTHALPVGVDGDEVRRVRLRPAVGVERVEERERASRLAEPRSREARASAGAMPDRPAAGQEARARVGDLDRLGPAASYASRSARVTTPPRSCDQCESDSAIVPV